MAMNPEIKERWTTALRSGDYEQGIHALHKIEEGDQETWCCWGVLCDLVKDDVGGSWEEGEDFDMLLYFVMQGDSGHETRKNAFPPKPVLRYVGIEVDDRVNDDEISLVGELASLNDTRTPFDEIAAVIEAKL